jgi:hypothetical protein
MVIGAVLLLAGGVLGCSSSSSKDDCGDVAKKACDKFYDCGFVATVDGVPVTRDGCVSALDLQASMAGLSDEQCRNEWAQGEDLACGTYFVWFLD